jgi:hypothetical protein
MLTLTLADAAGLAWAQGQVTAHHYLRRPVDDRCAPLAYLVLVEGQRAGCLLFGRPEATACYRGDLRYGGADARAAGRCDVDRWEVLNLARVWLDPRIQRGGSAYVPNAGTRAIGEALRRVVLDYLLARPPCFPDEPWRLRWCLSYCDTRIHHGGLYRAAGFARVHANAAGIETWARPLRPLRRHEAAAVLRAANHSHRSRVYRSQRAARAEQLELL